MYYSCLKKYTTISVGCCLYNTTITTLLTLGPCVNVKDKKKLKKSCGYNNGRVKSAEASIKSRMNTELAPMYLDFASFLCEVKIG